MASYLKWLEALVVLGPKLVLLWPILMRIIAAVKEGIAVVNDRPTDDPGALQVMEVTKDELALEQKIVGQLTTETALFDGTVLRSAWKFLQDHPVAAEVFWKFISGGFKKS
jgi:hypothetical protein